MRGGIVVNSRAKLNRHLSHLIIDAVGEGDEGVYTVKNPEKPDDVRRLTLIVRGTGSKECVLHEEWWWTCFTLTAELDFNSKLLLTSSNYFDTFWTT